MFVSQAHSFRQQARLSITMAWVAGYTNLVTLMACGAATSHVSGTATSLGKDLAEGAWELGAYAAFLLVNFFIGAVISGLCTELGRRRNWDSIYVLPMVIETILLAVFALVLELTDDPSAVSVALYVMTGAASMAMGLQNATITRISSGVVRTTHVTGVLTDLGHEAVQFLWWILDRLRNKSGQRSRDFIGSLKSHPSARRLALLLSIFITFAVGAALGTLVYGYAPRWAMFPPVGFLLWIIYQDVSIPIAELTARDPDRPDTDKALPSIIGVYQLQNDGRRQGKIHRLPNLLAWADRVPERKKVVILDLARLPDLNSNATMELNAVWGRFLMQGRQLVVAGISSEQFRRTHIVEELDPEGAANVCGDIDKAIARALELADALERLQAHQPADGASKSDSAPAS